MSTASTCTTFRRCSSPAHCATHTSPRRSRCSCSAHRQRTRRFARVRQICRPSPTFAPDSTDCPWRSSSPRLGFGCSHPPLCSARLSRRLALLTSGPRNLPERQQTLRNAIDWSYELLEQAEQVVFRRLSVFAGGCSLAQAEAVCDEAIDIVEALGSLIDKSLLQRRNEHADEPRFAMLETVREYAAERLEESPRSVRRASGACALVPRPRGAGRTGAERAEPGSLVVGSRRRGREPACRAGLDARRWRARHRRSHCRRAVALLGHAWLSDRGPAMAGPCPGRPSRRRVVDVAGEGAQRRRQHRALAR